MFEKFNFHYVHVQNDHDHNFHCVHEYVHVQNGHDDNFHYVHVLIHQLKLNEHQKSKQNLQELNHYQHHDYHNQLPYFYF
jgi:hypothetical protein